MQCVVHFFEHLQSTDVVDIANFYTDDAKFKDPFNEVQGVQAIQRIFSHMFESLDAPRFVITECVQQGAHCFVTWDFFFSIPRLHHGAMQTIRGAPHFGLREEAGKWRIAIHRDYWDAA